MILKKLRISWPNVYCVGAVVAGVYYGMTTKKKISKTTFPEAICEDSKIDKAGHLIKYKGTWLPKFLFPKEQTFLDIKNFRLDPADILVVSFPKSGTTWVQEIVWRVLNAHEHGAVISGANIEERFPYLEYIYPGLRDIAKRPSPKLIKSHLPYHLLPADVHSGIGKVIYIARNAKDVSVSYYHFLHLLSFLKYTGDFNHFFDNFMNGTVSSGPWVDHVREFWIRRDQENVLFITYEEMHQNQRSVIEKIAMFMGSTLTEKQIDGIVSMTSFESMKKDNTTNYSWWLELGLTTAGRKMDGNTHNKGQAEQQQSEPAFMRKGVVGDWKNYFTAEMNAAIERECLEPLERLQLYFNAQTVKEKNVKQAEKNT